MSGNILLLVTWFWLDQPPHSYQAEFATPASCEAARMELLEDASRLQEIARENARALTLPSGRTVIPERSPAPRVTAICVAR